MTRTGIVRAILCPLLLLSASTALAQARFGAYCQADFQNGWQNALPHVWNTCSNFNDELDDTDYSIFYWNLHGAKSFWETPNDQLYMDNVNLVWTDTHGGTTSTDAIWAMWDQNSLAVSNNIMLGNESYGLSIWANYACDTLKNDGKIWTRWATTFSAGLRYVAGSHDKVYSGTTLDDVGEDFADELQSSATIKYAWRDGASDWWQDQDLAVMSFGNSSSDACARKDNMKWQNYPSFPRRNSPTNWCRTYWTDY